MQIEEKFGLFALSLTLLGGAAALGYGIWHGHDMVLIASGTTAIGVSVLVGGAYGIGKVRAIYSQKRLESLLNYENNSKLYRSITDSN